MSDHRDGADAASMGSQQPGSAGQGGNTGHGAAAGGQGPSQVTEQSQGCGDACGTHASAAYTPGAIPPPWPYDPRWAGYVPYPYPAPGYPGGVGPQTGQPFWGAAETQGQGGYGMGQGAGQGFAHGARVSDVVQEIAGGGSGLSSLGRMLNLDDVDFWKGALVGAAAVLLLTNDSVQNAIFGQRSGGKAAGGNGGEMPE